MNITSGKQPHAIKLVLYGVEGIGKSTFASQAPDPLFIDTEGSTKDLDVRRIDPAPKTWMELVNYVMEIRNSNVQVCQTLVIDTADWAERMCIRHVCDKAQKNGIEDWGYGKGYTYVYEEFGKLLNVLTDIVNKGTNVIILAHAVLKKFEQPDETGSYDRYTLKLNDTPKTSIANMVKEWADRLSRHWRVMNFLLERPELRYRLPSQPRSFTEVVDMITRTELRNWMKSGITDWRSLRRRQYD